MTLHKLSATGLAIIMALACASAGAQQQESQSQQPMNFKEAKAKIAERFKAADINHDGKLTREEAKAGMPEVYKHFDEIDVRKRGYVTLRQIGAYWGAKTKEQMQKEDPIWN